MKTHAKKDESSKAIKKLIRAQKPKKTFRNP